MWVKEVFVFISDIWKERGTNPMLLIISILLIALGLCHIKEPFFNMDSRLGIIPLFLGAMWFICIIWEVFKKRNDNKEIKKQLEDFIKSQKDMGFTYGKFEDALEMDGALWGYNWILSQPICPTHLDRIVYLPMNKVYVFFAFESFERLN